MFYGRLTENARTFLEQKKHNKNNNKTGNASADEEQAFNKFFSEPFQEYFHTSLKYSQAKRLSTLGLSKLNQNQCNQPKTISMKYTPLR